MPAAFTFSAFLRRVLRNKKPIDLTSTTPNTVLTTVATVAGNRKSAGLTDPCVARNPITVVGNSCKLVAEITVSMIMFCEARFSPVSIS